jgi:hypothetical protein
MDDGKSISETVGEFSKLVSRHALGKLSKVSRRC